MCGMRILRAGLSLSSCHADSVPTHRFASSKAGAQAVYFPACINRMFGNSDPAHPANLLLPQAVVELGRRSGVPVWIPQDVGGRCCGTLWSSKGYNEGFKYHASQNIMLRRSLTTCGGGPTKVNFQLSSMHRAALTESSKIFLQYYLAPIRSYSLNFAS